MQRMDLCFHGNQSFQATLKGLERTRGHGMHLCEMCLGPVAQLSISAHFNMPKKMFCRLSPFLYHFIKMMSNKTTNVYFHGPSHVCVVVVGISCLEVEQEKV